ncbi:NAD-dependent epimerase/dehydratase family protein [Vibrio cholerae]|uniref:NAD-dependent epimerase/dehydratase family protein n=1 Tax=Vibrio cholerae TaxID=666 RepID=UPI00205172E3|nr:NAD-dependent epimerase/dehydratase family protein [Vibrio cholerae]MCU4202726.1 NAD-dependent epimerase/dehydratase family protein [Vibrio cholerae]MCU4204657.1 NAD-dependent epimerase/dehydratase family protein [Vibrio cholerae]BCN18459.1 putative reductase [Vibrio cholerae]GHX80314.1 protein CapI [Vibrio cholerae]
MKKVVVTGCFGYIGSSVYHALSKKGFIVAGIGRGGDDSDKMRINGDVSFLSLDRVCELIGGPPDVIFHFAGGSSVGRAEIDPAYNFESTVHSLSCLLEWVRLKCSDASIIVSSSAAVYGKSSSSTLTIASECCPTSIYGHHKMISEDIADIYSSRYELNVCSVRLFSVYGEGLRKQILWDTCQKLLKNEAEIEIFGTGQEKRDWIHISDVVSAFLTLATEVCLPNRMNLGTGNSHTVSQLIGFIIDAWSSKAAVTFNGVSRKGDPKELVLAPGAGLNNTLELSSGVKLYVDWFKSLHEVV